MIKKIHNSTSLGFTLIEILLSVALITLIMGFSVPFYSSLQSKNSLSVSASALTQSLREAKLRSQAVDGDSPWGVYVEIESIILFQGATYATRNPGYDQTFDLPQGIVPTGLNEVVFTKLEGQPSQIGSITLTHSNGPTVDLTINEKGMVYQPI